MDVSPRAGLKRYQVEKDEKKKKIKPNPIQMINPEITWISEKKDIDQEGCLSIPDVREDVSRKSTVTIEYMDENFKKHTDTYEGLTARVIQHEYDHIDGILFTDKLTALRKRMIKGKLMDISKGKVNAAYKMRFSR